MNLHLFAELLSIGPFCSTPCKSNWILSQALHLCMFSNWLNLNSSKTKRFWFGTPQFLHPDSLHALVSFYGIDFSSGVLHHPLWQSILSLQILPSLTGSLTLGVLRRTKNDALWFLMLVTFVYMIREMLN